MDNCSPPSTKTLLENVLDNAADGISVLDPDLNILWLNATMRKRQLQSNPSSGCKCYQKLHMINHPCRYCPAIRALETCSPSMVIVPMPKDQQEKGWLELHAFPLLNEKGVPIVVVEFVRNFTDPVSMAKTLGRSEQLYRMVADLSHNWEYWIAPDRSYVYVSPSCERITGYPASAFFEDPELMVKIIFKDDREWFVKYFQDNITSQEVISCEFRIESKSGEERWISHFSQPVYNDEERYIGRWGSNRDITQSKKKEEALRQAYQALKNSIKDRTAQLKIAARELQVREAELSDHKSKLERVNRELIETNKAVTILARKIDKQRQDVESRSATTIGKKILPLIEELKNAKTPDIMLTGLDQIATYMQILSNELIGNVNSIASLTPTELRVAALIKRGLTSQSIADKLHVSLHTIKSHRRNIRKKLGINNALINLETYLRSVVG